MIFGDHLVASLCRVLVLASSAVGVDPGAVRLTSASPGDVLGTWSGPPTREARGSSGLPDGAADLVPVKWRRCDVGTVDAVVVGLSRERLVRVFAVVPS